MNAGFHRTAAWPAGDPPGRRRGHRRRTFTISNGLNAAVALLAPVYWWSIGLPLWPDAAIQVAVAPSLRRPRRHFLHGHDGRRRRQAGCGAGAGSNHSSTFKILVIMSLAGGILTLIVLFHKKRGKAPMAEGGAGATPRVPYGWPSQSARFGFSPNAFLTNLPDLWGRFRGTLWGGVFAMNVKKVALLVGALVIAVITAVMAKNMFAGAGAPQAAAAQAVPTGPKILVARKALRSAPSSTRKACLSRQAQGACRTPIIRKARPDPT